MIGAVVVVGGGGGVGGGFFLACFDDEAPGEPKAVGGQLFLAFDDEAPGELNAVVQLIITSGGGKSVTGTTTGDCCGQLITGTSETDTSVAGKATGCCVEGHFL